MDKLLEKIGSYLLAPFQSGETFLSAISGAITAVTDLSSKTAWLYLLTSFLIGSILYRIEPKRNPTSLWRFIVPRNVYLHRSAIVDYKFVALDLTIKAVLYSPLIAGFSMLVYKASTAAFVSTATALDWSPTEALMGTIALPILGIVLGDFAFFLSHYLMHKIPVLWYFHEVHHSAEVLTPVTVYRVHPVEDLINAVVSAFIAGVAAATYTSATDSEVTLPAIFGVNLIQFAFFSFAFQLRHSHVWLSYGPVLSRILISPAQHQVHHSTDPKHWDKNFGFMFAIWDVMFRSLYVPHQRETLQFGTRNADPNDFSTVWKLYSLPFVKAAHRIHSALRQRRFGNDPKRT